MAAKDDNLARRAEIGRERRARTRAKIVSAAFEAFGDEHGLSVRIDDIADLAGVTRATFYAHFAGMDDLREALTHELTHDFLEAVTNTVDPMPDPRQRAATAVRFYLRRASQDRKWAWSMINLSATGIIFGSETFSRAEQTIQEGIDAEILPLPSSKVGRDLLMGTSLAAVESMARGDTDKDYPEAIAGYILMGLGVPFQEARKIAHLPLPELVRA